MTIKFLKAGSGDCILIQHNHQNILIDGGNEFKFLQDQIAEIHSNDEKIDLLIITHHDDDHISGIIRLLELNNKGTYGEGFIKKVIFNSPRKVLGKISNDDLDQSLSYRQAVIVEELLRDSKCSWMEATDKSPNEEFSEIRLRFLSPSQDDLEKYSTHTGAYLTGDYRCDWDASMISLEQYIDDASIDQSLPNKTSIVILVESPNCRILLSGDCTPDRLGAILEGLISEGTEELVSLDYFKLPHHGSYRSLTKRVLEQIKCSKFIISTDSKRHFLPNKRALLKIIKYMQRESGGIEFLFNYGDTLNNMNITAEERKRYGLRLITNNQHYGLSI